MSTKKHQGRVSLMLTLILLFTLIVPATAWGTSGAGFASVEPSYAKSESLASDSAQRLHEGNGDYGCLSFDF